MEGFEAKFRKTVKEYHMLEPGDRVIAAVSGGADSVCLLALLKEMRASLKLCLRAVHVHHGLREGEADRDAEFVSELCSALGVPCH
ncbi:MAG: ATP-binding protein, partial [Clostridiales bacterium]|nr:ATP-binding protein [Clostridiales bacterium]